ncbi:MAG: hypothetical protein M3337_07365 [Actinomycetota bacterium]|nr:hypothetical protein [Actinomycetota bacterium]
MIGHWYFTPAPARRLGVTRVLLGAYTLRYMVKRWRLITRTAAGARRNFRPVGVAKPLRRPLPINAVKALTIANYGATAAFTAGWRHRITGPLHALLTLWTLTYRNSWSMVFHSDNLVVFHGAILGVSPAADAVSLDARRLRTPPAPSWRYGWPLQLANTVTVITYALAGVAKLRGPLGIRWASGDSLRAQVAADGIRKSALVCSGEGLSPAVAHLERRPELWRLLATGSLLLELFAPIALLDRRLGRVWSLAAWSMHVGIKVIMRLTFRYQLSGVTYAPFFDVERLVAPLATRSASPIGAAA